jgi:DNA polymerase III subunit epsilon
MRQIILDTETTGLSWEKGNRVVEIGCVELLERRRSGNVFQCYINPEREMEVGAQEVTGLTREFLADKPKFASIVHEFLDYVRGAELIIHNAAFDVGFLNYELSLLGEAYGKITDHCKVLDSLQMARERYPGQRNSLDALCKRLSVDNEHRKLHGALLDAELLTDVYLALTSGQGDLSFASAGASASTSRAVDSNISSVNLGALSVRRADEQELQAHQKRLEGLQKKSGGQCVWLQLEESGNA